LGERHQGSVRSNALRVDPWFIAKGPNGDSPRIATRQNLAHRHLGFTLANGPGVVVKFEYLTDPRISTRITFRLTAKTWYRIVQYGHSARGYGPRPKDHVAFRRHTIYGVNRELGFAAAVWWSDSRLGAVEVASDELSLRRLFTLAKQIIVQSDKLASRKRAQIAKRSV
jgi:hypothetical protein